MNKTDIKFLIIDNSYILKKHISRCEDVYLKKIIITTTINILTYIVINERNADIRSRIHGLIYEYESMYDEFRNKEE